MWLHADEIGGAPDGSCANPVKRAGLRCWQHQGSSRAAPPTAELIAGVSHILDSTIMGTSASGLQRQPPVRQHPVTPTPPSPRPVEPCRPRPSGLTEQQQSRIEQAAAFCVNVATDGW